MQLQARIMIPSRSPPTITPHRLPHSDWHLESTAGLKVHLGASVLKWGFYLGFA